MARGNLPKGSDSVGFGTSTGENASFNAFQDIKRPQSYTGTNTLKNFLDWCASYVRPPGDPNSAINPGAPYRMAAETRNLEIIAITLWIRNESFSKYGTNNDAAVQVRVDYPNDGRLYAVTGIYPSGSSSVTITNNTAWAFGGSGWDAGGQGTVIITDLSTGVTCSIYAYPGYSGGGASCVGTSTMGGAGVTYPKGGTTAFNNPMFFYSGPRDPSGRVQG